MKGYSWVIGIDEVGRGPIAGPVAICACAIRAIDYKKASWKGLNDSKKMSPKNRELWFEKARELKKQGKIIFCISYQSSKFIDKKGISAAIKNCIKKALLDLEINSKDSLVLLDGSLVAPKEYLNQKTIIKGDQKEKIISLASVIAKVSRDKKMVTLSKKYPKYEWSKNKGYGTSSHYKSLSKYGVSPEHRKSFLRLKTR